MPPELRFPEPTAHAQRVLRTLLEWDYGNPSNPVSAEWLFSHASARLPVRFIEPSGHRYVERYFLAFHEGLIHYLHRFVSADGDRQQHVHPFASTSRILTGYYIEDRAELLSPERMTQPTELRHDAGSLSVIDLNAVHRIKYTAPDTWTLFAHTLWTDLDWGFYDVPDQNGRTKFTREVEGSSNRNWWLTAPRGDQSRRLPFGHPPDLANATA